MRLTMLLTGCSLALVFSGCQTVPRPDTNICVFNVPALHEKCYNLNTDYDDNGELKPGAQPVIRQYKDEAEMLAALNKKIGTDPDGWANLKAYIRNLRRAQRQGD